MRSRRVLLQPLLFFLRWQNRSRGSKARLQMDPFSGADGFASAAGLAIAAKNPRAIGLHGMSADALIQT